MNTYLVSVNMLVEVEAFDEADAQEAVSDCFGPGDTCGLNVVDFKVNNVR